MAGLATAMIVLPGGAQSIAQPLGKLPRGLVSKKNVLLPPRATTRGWMILIHGGGWMATGLVWRDPAAWYQARGWGVYAIDHRAGIYALPDTLAAYDWLRRRHPNTPICAHGSSSGGWLVMMLATLRTGLSCAVSQAGPTDLRSWESLEPTRELREWVHLMMAYSFAGRLWTYSPVRLASGIRAPLLLATASADVWVPRKQMEEMKRARPSTITMTLQSVPTRPGVSLNFTHTSVTRQALSKFRSVVATLLNGAYRARHSHDPRS